MRTSTPIPAADWPREWLDAILHAAAKLDGPMHENLRKRKQPAAASETAARDYWRAYILAARDLDWTLTPMQSIRFDQIAPNGTIIYQRPSNPVPLIGRLSAEALAAIAVLAQTPRPDGRVFAHDLSDMGLRHRWHRLIESAGFDRKSDKVPGVCRCQAATSDPAPPKPIAGEPQTIIQFLEHTYAPLRLSGKSPRTLLLYQISIRSFSKHLGREAMLSDLTDETVAKYLAAFRESGKRPATVAKEYCHLLAIWRFACRRHLIVEYPTIVKPKIPRADPQAWTAADLAKLIAALRVTPGWIADVEARDWWLAIHYVIWNTAERISAVMALQWSDIDLTGGWVTVRAEYRKGKGEDKTTALAPYTLEALRAIHSAKRSSVFPWPHHPTYLWTCYRRILKAAGLPSDRRSMFHRLRRTVATHFEALGGDATKLLGHFDRVVTDTHYLDPKFLKRPQAIDLLPAPQDLKDLPQAPSMPAPALDADAAAWL